MSDFKGGDRVRIISYADNPWSTLTDLEGTLRREDSRFYRWRVVFDSGESALVEEGEIELVSTKQDPEAELKRAKEKVAELEKQISDHKNRFTNAKLKDVVEVDHSEYVKVAPNSWVLISGTERSGNATYVFRDKQLLGYAEEEDDFH